MVLEWLSWEWIQNNWGPMAVAALVIGWGGYRLLVRYGPKKWLKKRKPVVPDIEESLKERGFGKDDNPESIAIQTGESFREWEKRLHGELLKIGEAIKKCEQDMNWRKQVYTRLKQDEWRVTQMLQMLRRQPGNDK